MQVYVEVKLEGQPMGAITFELLRHVSPVGAQRFADLVVGKEGVGYRLSRFDGIYEVCPGGWGGIDAP